MKKILTFLLTALLTFGVGWAETKTDVITAADLPATSTSYVDFSGVTISGGSDAVYAGSSAKNSAGAIQLSSSNQRGIVSTTSGGKLKSVTIEVASGSNTIDVYAKSSAYTGVGDLYNTSNQGAVVGSLTNGNSGTITITGDYSYVGIRSRRNAVYISKITIVWEASSSSIEAPTISPSSGDFLATQQVTITHPDNTVSIYYTLDGSDPTSSNTRELYNGTITLNATTTVRAVAMQGSEYSAEASATYTKVGADNIAEAYGMAQNANFTFTGSAVVTYQSPDKKYTFIRDASGSGLIYGSNQPTFTNGDILDANWTASNIMYGSIPEFSNPGSLTSSTNGGIVAPFDYTATGITTADVNKYVSFTGVVPQTSTSEQYSFVTIGSNTFYLRDFFSEGLSVTAGKTYDLEGIAYIGPSNRPFLYLTKVTEIATGNPYIEVSPTSLTISDSGTNNTFTVQGSNLGDDNVGVTVPQGSAFSTTTTDQSWGFVNNNGSVNGTVTVTYGGRALWATETVTAANNLTSATVNVTYVPDLYIVSNQGNGWDYSAGGAVAMTHNGNGTYTATLQNLPANSYILFARTTGVTYNWENDANRIFIGADTNGGDWAFGTNTSGNLDTDPTNDYPVKYHPIYFSEAGTYVITITVNTNNGTGTFSIEKETSSSGDFVLVTDASDLAVGNEVIIVNSGTAGSARTMGQRNANNYYGTGVTVSSTLKVTPTNDTQIFALEQGNGGWYFKTSDDKYLSSYTTTSNYLQTKGKDENGSGTSLAVINIGSGNVASIVFQGEGTRKTLQYNPNGITTNPSANDIFSCYGGTQQDVYIYQRAASDEPSITVDPSTINIVISAGNTSEQGTATVTESNTTGTTTVSVSGDDANYFTASLNNGTLTVTYSGTATASDPDVAVVTLDNDGTTATVNVTGYKVPMTVTITPGDGHTFSTSMVTGLIESNVADALIEYSFDGTIWYTYDANDGFTTPEVNNIGGTITVYARATKNGETATAQATYTRVAPSTKCTADIVFDPTSNDGGVTQWETLQGHMSEGTDYISDASMETVYTSNTYDAFRFGSGRNVGHMTFTLDPTKFTGGAVKLTKVTVNAARYSNDTDCELTVSTDVNTTGQTLSITADQMNFADYVFNFDGSEITTLTIANVTAGKRVYVHSISLEYNCGSTAQVATLADIESSVEQNKLVIVDNELIGAWAVVNPQTGEKLLWAKDQGNISIDKRPGMIEGKQRDYVKEILKYEKKQTWDESNWVILDFANIDSNDGDPEDYVGRKIKAATVEGIYSDTRNYTITLTKAPSFANETSQEMDAAEYPGWQEPFNPNWLGEAYAGYGFAYNTFVPANFMTENHNRLENGEVVGGFVADNTALPGLAGDSLYFVNPKIQEVARVWAVWCGNDETTGERKDLFSVYKAEHKENENINAWNLNGTFHVKWDYNCKSKDSGVDGYGAPTGLVEGVAYEFHAVVMRPKTRLTANGDVEPQGTLNPGTATPDYEIYPLDVKDGGTPTAVVEVFGTKTVVSVMYYNLMGQQSSKPFEGINIVVTRYSDGSTSSVKVLR